MTGRESAAKLPNTNVLAGQWWVQTIAMFIVDVHDGMFGVFLQWGSYEEDRYGKHDDNRLCSQD